MGGTTLRDRLIEVADAVNNDAELARIAKVSRSAVSQWRTGDVKSLKALSAVNIQERTGYSVRWLILGIGPKKITGKSDKADVGAIAHTERPLNPSDDKKLLAVLRAFFDTDQEGRTQIVEAVEAITASNGHTGQHDRPAPKPRRGGITR